MTCLSWYFLLRMPKWRLSYYKFCLPPLLSFNIVHSSLKNGPLRYPRRKMLYLYSANEDNYDDDDDDDNRYRCQINFHPLLKYNRFETYLFYIKKKTQKTLAYDRSKAKLKLQIRVIFSTGWIVEKQFRNSCQADQQMIQESTVSL